VKITLVQYLIGGVALAAVTGLVVFLAVPKSITGDVATDAACRALAEHFLAEGPHPDQTAVMRQMSPERMNELVESVTEHTAEASIPEVRAAGEKLAAAGIAPGGLFGVLGIMAATAEVIEACGNAGWTPQAAGLVPDGPR
jgi:hypothetical protein